MVIGWENPTLRAQREERADDATCGGHTTSWSSFVIDGTLRMDWCREGLQLGHAGEFGRDGFFFTGFCEFDTTTCLNRIGGIVFESPPKCNGEVARSHRGRNSRCSKNSPSPWNPDAAKPSTSPERKVHPRLPAIPGEQWHRNWASRAERGERTDLDDMRR